MALRASTRQAPAFAFADDLAPWWNPRQREFSAAANSVSLTMPFVEPYFVKAVRAALPDLEGPLRDEAERFVVEESSHHAAHRTYNDVVRRRYPRVARLERVIQRTCRWLWETRSRRFSLAFAAGSEAIAFALARYADKRLARLQVGSEPEVARLFLWHLAEEVEHKSVAFDVYEAVDGSRLRYAVAMTMALSLLVSFVAIGTLIMLFADRKLWNPLTYVRLAGWTISCAFDVLPTLALSAWPGHHPSDFADPAGFRLWLLGDGGPTPLG